MIGIDPFRGPLEGVSLEFEPFPEPLAENDAVWPMPTRPGPEMLTVGAGGTGSVLGGGGDGGWVVVAGGG